MPFVNQIRAIPNPFRFSAAIAAAAEAIPAVLLRTAFRRAGRGVEILETDARLNDYLVAYGEMHVAKLKRFLPSLPFAGMSTLALVDWGCGQGLAASIALEYVREEFPDVRVVCVRVVEISEAARKRAFEIVSRYENAHDVRASKWNLASLSQSGIELPPDISVLHVFSNILDVAGVEGEVLASLIHQCSTGRDSYMLCVGPKACSTLPVKTFVSRFKGASLLTVDDACVSVAGMYYPYGTCSCYGLTFHVPAVPAAAQPAVELPEVRFYPEDLFAYAAADMGDEVTTAVERGVDVDSVDRSGNTALMFAAKYGAVSALRSLLHAGANVDRPNAKGATALYFASKNGEDECLSILLKAGAAMESRTHSSGLTPYLVAVKYGRTKCASLLEEAGCDVTACDARGRDARRLAEYLS
ncbi:MAG: ankyrin repeat domain-containing protein [Kiritimatiellae bacterium]|nr:ankyrin repeat domain-containing protein [Kiritimatiellia bacterium]